jgi:Cu2+-exporting ATPase
VTALDISLDYINAGAAAAEAVCAHCGDRLRSGAVVGDGKARFCCNGCAAAFQIISGLGMSRFYALRRAAAGDARLLRPETESAIDVAAYARTLPNGRTALDLMVDGLTCAACVWLIESVLAREPGLAAGRVSLGSRRLHLEWTGDTAEGDRFVAAVERLGYRLVPFDPTCLAAAEDETGRRLLKALAVAGFASANVMLFSVSLWSGVEMGPMTRDLLHWFSALIALPAIAYAGQPFFRSAWNALRQGRASMDLPISLGVLLVSLMSIVETARGAEHAYFDGAVMLLFFLLIGRFLDYRARRNARSAVQSLLALRGTAVAVLLPNGGTITRRPETVTAGQDVIVAAGERIGIDGIIIRGDSELDTSLVTGEASPAPARPGVPVFAGTLNLAQPLVVRATAVGEGTLLAEIARMMEAAESRRGRFVALADRVSRFYVPVVHLAALATFLVWLFVLHAPWQTALTCAVAVLLVTCPCALGLAVPAVQVIASGHLMRRGILIKNPTALDRLAEIDTVVFDKTGTLTEGALDLCDAVDREALADAAEVAQVSRHPLSVALVRAAREQGIAPPPASEAVEQPGQGIVCSEIRLGSRAFCCITETAPAIGPELWLTRPGKAPACFVFRDRLRGDAADVVAGLKHEGLAVKLRSGDNAEVVDRVADMLGIEDRSARQTPADKVAALEALRQSGAHVLMAGDGLNDAPALAAAHVSISPSTAADISQTASDIVFQGARLSPVLEAISCAKRARSVARENIALALG